MTVEQARLLHPRFVYKRVTSSIVSGSVVCSFEFLLEPDIVFRSTVTIPSSGPIDLESFQPYAFHLGMIEAISYWKTACPRTFEVEAGYLSEDQIRFWHDLILHGLGEFFFRNGIDATGPSFLTINASGPKTGDGADTTGREPTGDLVLVSGGKDTSVTLGMLTEYKRSVHTMMLNPTEAAEQIAAVSGYDHPIRVTRTMDPRLLTLNAQGYLNGHTPFSAYLAFLGIAVAHLNGYERVIVSNERSANEGNVMFHGVEINHQYSKSYRFEQMFRAYTSSAFSGAPSYFSMLRPFNDLQIARLFTAYPRFFPVFRSCNVGSRQNRWCGTCPKCAFTFLALSPFLPVDMMETMFGANLFESDEVLGHIRALTGLSPVKPFECVGTRSESILALTLTVERHLRENREVPQGLLRIHGDLGLTPEQESLLKREVLETWGALDNLPEEYVVILRAAWEAHGQTD